MQPTNPDRAQIAALGAALRLRAAAAPEMPARVALPLDLPAGLDERDLRRVADAARAAAERQVALILEHRRMWLCLETQRAAPLTAAEAGRLSKLTRRLSPARWRRACDRFAAVVRARREVTP